MATNDYKTWSEKLDQPIYKDENGDWMIDEFGPTDDFSLMRDLFRELENLTHEQSILSPIGPVPIDEESRLISRESGDLDAIYFALLQERIDSLKGTIQAISDGNKGGRTGIDKAELMQDVQTVLKDLESVTQKNPHKTITHSRIADELIDKHGYEVSRKYLAERVSKVINK